MTDDLSNSEGNSKSSPPATEVEYALILSKMIEVAERDPSQLRLAIYEFARTKLNYNTINADRTEQRKLSAALEAAIAGVERFSQRGGRKGIKFRDGEVEIADPHLTPRSAPVIAELSRDINDQRRPSSLARKPDLRSLLHKATASHITRYWFSGAVLIFAVIVVISFLMTQTWRDSRMAKSAASVKPPAPNTFKSETEITASTSREIEFPLPRDYGVYLINGSSLAELVALPERVPDKRIEISTPIDRVGQAVSADGDPKFLVFRREFANEAPDQFELRVMARVARVINFNSKGKPVFSPAPAGWIIRNTAYEFKVRPLPNRPEMLLLQPKQTDLLLPPGRYVLTIKERGFDFTIAGDVTDPAQCVERTDAANGSFFSNCQAQ